jgi:[ribosomal protein S5]-alanine N-acetyltransferase
VNDLSLPIRGERVSIRRLEERYFEDLYALETDPDVKRYVGGPVQRPRDECIRLMQSILGAETCPLVIELNEDGSFVGSASLARTFLATTSPGAVWPNEWEIKVLIARKFWGNGFGREAASKLIISAFTLQEVTSVVSVVDPENTASRKLMDNLGFQCVGRKCSQTLDPVGGKYVKGWDHEHMIFRLARPNE